MADTVWGTLLLNFEPFLLLLAVINLFDAFVIGFDGSDFLNTVVRYIHPLPMLLSLIGNAKFELSIAACVFWLLLTAAMVALTIRFAVRRPAELAENTSVDNWYRLLLKVTSAYLIAYLFANMVFYSMASGTTPYFDSGEKGLYLAATAAGAALGFLVVEVVFGRGFKTLRGNGSNAGMIVDKLNLPEIVGSIAGDDTLLIVAASEEKALVVVEKLNEFLK